jgi:hypothetical protein
MPLRNTLSMISLVFISFYAQAQELKALQVSPGATVTQELGISSLRIDYHRPAVKTRAIWGDLVPYGKVWRAGANEATLFTFSDPVKIAGREMPAGSYAFFVIPEKASWTLIFNRQGKQWGAYNYKPEQDALRFEVKPWAIPQQEYLQFDVSVKTPEQLFVELRWEKLAAGFEVDIDVKGIYWKYLEETLAKASASKWQPWFQGARYCLEQGIQPGKAMQWIDASLKAEENHRNLECKARLLQKAGKTAEALATLDRAIEAARAKAPKDYVAGLEKTREEWKGKS